VCELVVLALLLLLLWLAAWLLMRWHCTWCFLMAGSLTCTGDQQACTWPLGSQGLLRDG
jgi:hypothetical protein